MGISCEAAMLAGLRSLVIFVAMAVIGLGAWILHTIHDVEVRGGAILDMKPLGDAAEILWREFFRVLIDGQMRIWIAIGAGSFTFPAALFVFLSLKMERLKVSPYLLVPLEVLSMLVMAGALAATSSLAIQLDPLCIRLDSSGSPDLMPFAMLCPLGKSYSIAAGVGWFVLAITSLAALIEAYQRARRLKACSFEPTASALGMSHGYQAVIPPMPRNTIPTLYDPAKPIPTTSNPAYREEDKEFIINGAEMGRRDSGLSYASKASEKEISGPLGLQTPAAVQQIRPARPWSEAPKRR